MQKMTADELQGFRSEFEMTCAAQDGNGKAWMQLWNRYKGMMMSRLTSAKGFSGGELESEALEVFAYKLRLFDRSKVSSEDNFSMFSWLFCAVVNRTNKLIRQRKKDVHLYFENVNAAADQNENADTFYYDESENPNSLQSLMLGVNEDIYFAYNPERLVVAGLHEDDTERVKAFYARLTQFEKNILDARREGQTLAQVAKKFCCSVTTVKNHIRTAKQYAEEIFQISYA
jgi:DNA-directed RNA polymerase specialized sigma24 family protein